MSQEIDASSDRTYSVVIATCDREEELELVLHDWAAQSSRPEGVVVVRPEGYGSSSQSSGVNQQGPVYEQVGVQGIRIETKTSSGRSAAKQRNLGAQEVATEWVVFCDDDVRFGPDLAAETQNFLAAHPEAVAVFPRMRGSGHPKPGRLLHWYYGLQAGFTDETFGARLFGAGISCYPCWEAQAAPVECDWLPSTMLWMKSEVFRRHHFPDFEGYSFGEDAHLTHRAWREASQSGGKMFFLSEPVFEHLSIQSGVKANRFHLGRMAVRNQRRIAREAMGKGAWEVFWKSLAHRGFLSLALLKRRRRGWVGELAGIWSA